MTFSSVQAWLALLLAMAVSSLLRDRAWRQLLLAACSAGVLWSLVPNAGSWVALAAFLLSGYLVAAVVRRRPSGLLIAGYVAALVGAFLVVRRYEFVTVWLPTSVAGHAILIVGLSYMLFRQIHFLVDAAQGQIERMSPWIYANYQLNFLTLLSGPIQRYQEFDEQWRELAPRHEDALAVQLTFLRLLVGYLKLALVAPWFLSLHGSCLQALTGPAPIGAGDAAINGLGLLYAFPIYLYLNFSGYCDIVIAAGRFFGLRLPENFDQPYLSRNVIEFWTRFHRTLGLWIRDYLFLPLYKWIAERWPKRADSLAFLCYFIAFFLAGVWHGPTLNFVVYGLLQAVGVSATKLWERHLLKRRGRPGLREYMKSQPTRVAAIVVTLHFEAFSLLFFPNDLATVGAVFRQLHASLF